MKLVDGADRMALRFTLLERTGVEGDRAVKAPGLRRWRWSKPGVVSLRYRQGVRNLTENATYRAKVDFRWYSSSGAELLRAQRRSAALPPVRRASQPDHSDHQHAAGEGARGDALPVARDNTGEAAVAAVPVRLTVDGDVVDTVSLTLDPHEARTVVIRGPECHRLARVEADPAKAIAETSEDDNAHELSCANLARL